MTKFRWLASYYGLTDHCQLECNESHVRRATFSANISLIPNDEHAILSSCSNNLALAPRGDSDRCIEGTVAACRAIKLVRNRVPVRGRRDSEDEGEINAGDSPVRTGSVESKVSGSTTTGCVCGIRTWKLTPFVKILGDLGYIPGKR